MLPLKKALAIGEKKSFIFKALPLRYPFAIFVYILTLPGSPDDIVVADNLSSRVDLL